MLRLFIDAPIAVGETLSIPPAQLAHVRARRAQVGHAVGVFNGDGNDALGELIAVSKRDFAIDVRSIRPGVAFAQPEVALALAVIANDRMDFAIQKACELGVARIIPLLAQRSQAPGNAAKRVSHWQAVAIAAAEQCGRARVATIEMPVSLDPALHQFAHSAWCFAEFGEPAFTAESGAAKAGVVAIGPEGGWTTEELARFRSHNSFGFSLGRAKLRAETAAIAALAKRISE